MSAVLLMPITGLIVLVAVSCCCPASDRWFRPAALPWLCSRVCAAARYVVPLIVIVTEPPTGSVAIVPLTVLPATLTEPGHTAPPVALPQLAVNPVIDAGTASENVVLLASEGPALPISS